MGPIQRRPSVSARVLRPSDLVDLRITALGAQLQRDGETPQLVAGADGGTLRVELAFQHLGEEAFEESLVSPEPAGLAIHRAARRSRLVYELPAGTTLEWTTNGILEALPRLRLKVVPLATRGPDHYPEDDAPAAGPHGGLLLPPWVFDRLTEAHGVLIPSLRNPAVTAAQGIRLVRGLTRDLHAGVHDLGIAQPPATAPGSGESGGSGGSGTTIGSGTRWGDILGRGIFTLEPGIRIPIPVGERPRAPGADETSLEVPYRLIVSPSAAHGAFTHDIDPVTAPADDGRTELWRTRLTTRVEDDDGAFLGHTDERTQRIVRAIWTRDLDEPDLPSFSDVALMSINPVDRRTLVRQSSATHEGVVPIPMRVDRLALSSLGAWVDWRGSWDTTQWSTLDGWGGPLTFIATYDHVASMGRDTYVQVTYPGFLFPFGHRCLWVKLTERKVHEPTRTAYLRQRNFIVLVETVRSWVERDTPFTQVTLDPVVTPDLDPPGGSGQSQAEALKSPFFPQRGGVPFRWDLTGVDRVGDTVSLSAPLLFVTQDAIVTMRDAGDSPQQIGQAVSSAYQQHARIDARGQQVSFAASAAHGDTRLETNSLTWDGHTDVDAYTSRPFLQGTNTVVPSLTHLAPTSPSVDLVYAGAYLAPEPGGDTQLGFGSANPSGLFLTLASPPVSLDFTGGTDRAGGFVAPNLMVRALSRSLGAVGDEGSTPGGLADGNFDAATFLQGALPKLFGLFDLVELIEAVAGPLDLSRAPAFVSEALDAISAIVTEAQRLREAILQAQSRLGDDLASAAHQGAQAAVGEAVAALDAAAAQLLNPLQQLLDALAQLGSGGGGGIVASATAAIEAVRDALSALDAAINHPRLPAAVRSALVKPATALKAMLNAADVATSIANLAEGLLSPGPGITARFEWRPRIGSWPSGSSPVFVANDPLGFALAVEVHAGAQSSPTVDVSAELRSFALQLLPGAPLLAMNFSRIGFRAGSNTKPEVDVVFDGMEFVGALAFIERLRQMIPFDGFADPPYVDVAPDGVTAGFDLTLPNVSVGVFSLENISLGADARVPFLGDAVTIGFNFCRKDSPFRLTVMCIGGGGWVALRLSPKGLVELEMGLEAAASLSIDLGVASGSVSISAGVYLRLEGDEGSLTGYFRIRGSVRVLGLISASITLELSLTYEFGSGKMVGRASVVVEVEVLFFSASVEIAVERRLAGSKGDPVLAEIMPPDTAGRSDDWSAYCAAFTPAGAP